MKAQLGKAENLSPDFVESTLYSPFMFQAECLPYLLKSFTTIQPLISWFFLIPQIEQSKSKVAVKKNLHILFFLRVSR